MMNLLMRPRLAGAVLALLLPTAIGAAADKNAAPARHPELTTAPRTLESADGFNGLWYMNQPSKDEYKYKYSGGFGTYPQQHIPLAVYRKEVDKTFFVYGGSERGKQELLHMISYYDHKTGKVARPRVLLNKRTDDAHDNPVLLLDDEGYIFVFSPSHGTARPSYISKSTRPYDISEFLTTSPFNFSYPQPKYVPGKGFLFFHTRYKGGRCLYTKTSRDGINWENDKLLAHMEQGHYQVSNHRDDGSVATAFNYHPAQGGLNARTNLYYMESADFGDTWKTAAGETLITPLKTTQTLALVHDYQAEGLLVYMKDLVFDKAGHPVILYITSKGYESGPKNDPRTWRTARWTGETWKIDTITTSGNNYDFGSLYIEDDSTWRLIAPTANGPQAYNPGGEMVMWTSNDEGSTWKQVKQLTRNSKGNHTFARRPVNAHPDFYAFWGDGNARQPSDSSLYFTDKTGTGVWQLPAQMTSDFAAPAKLD